MAAKDDSSFSKSLGEAVKFLRERAVMTQEELGEKAEISQGMISMIETGQRSNRISWNTLQKIASALNLEGLHKLIFIAENLKTACTLKQEKDGANRQKKSNQ
ncbi:MAG: helix-turn-helix transcriptional regulator [Candidatus Paceibacterota bacterium]